jgi:hypothetical protein
MFWIDGVGEHFDEHLAHDANGPEPILTTVFGRSSLQPRASSTLGTVTAWRSG